MRGSPAVIGGMPFRSKRASERQSFASSRSPCNTWIATFVWPSTPVVKCSVAEAGMVELRWMIFATTPPSASMPSDSGVTSSSSISSVAAEPPARMLACTAAPSATTSSGLSSVCGCLPRAASSKSSLTSCCTRGMRVDPPTSTTSSISVGREAGIAQCLAAGLDGTLQRSARSVVRTARA